MQSSMPFSFKITYDTCFLPDTYSTEQKIDTDSLESKGGRVALF